MNKTTDPTKLSKLHELDSLLPREIRGQSHTLPRIVSAVRRGELGLTKPARPRGSFLLLGPTGVGKTETTVDLGKKIAIEGLKVLLLDFDAQGTATLISSGLIPDLELRYEDTITNVLISNPTNIKNVILKTHFDGLDIIPANLAIQDCDLILPNEKENNHERLGSPFIRLTEALKIIKNQ